MLKQPLHLKSLAIKFKGRADITDWEKQFVSHKLCALVLPNIAPENVTLAAGTHDFAFDFNLSSVLSAGDTGDNDLTNKKLDPLPPSTATSYGSVQYRLVAVLTPSKALKVENISSQTLSNLRSTLAGKGGVLRGGQYRVAHPIVVHRPALPTMELLKSWQSKLAPFGFNGSTSDGQLSYCIKVNPLLSMDEQVAIHLRLETRAKIKKIVFDIIQIEKHKQHGDVKHGDAKVLKSHSSKGKLFTNVAPAAIKLAPNASTTETAPSVRSHPFHSVGHVATNESPYSGIVEFCTVLKQREKDTENKRVPTLKPTMRSALIQVKHRLRVAIQYIPVQEIDDSGAFQADADDQPLLSTTTATKPKLIVVQTNLRFTPIMPGTSTGNNGTRRGDGSECLTIIDEEDEFSDNPFVEGSNTVKQHIKNMTTSKAKRTAADKGLDVFVGQSTSLIKDVGGVPSLVIIPPTPSSARIAKPVETF